LNIKAKRLWFPIFFKNVIFLVHGSPIHSSTGPPPSTPRNMSTCHLGRWVVASAPNAAVAQQSSSRGSHPPPPTRVPRVRRTTTRAARRGDIGSHAAGETQAGSAVAGTPAPAAARALAATLGHLSLGDAVRADVRIQREIASIIADMERANPTASPTTSALLNNGTWRLRYTTSDGTRSSIAGWGVVAGAVTDVRQRFERSSSDAEAAANDVIRITNVVTVSVPPPSPPPFPLPLPPLPRDGVAVRITQRFAATVGLYSC
jgi:hypothetical protein